MNFGTFSDFPQGSKFTWQMPNKYAKDIRQSAKAGAKRALKIKNLSANLKAAGDLLVQGKVGKAGSRAARGIAQDFLDDGSGDRGGRGAKSLARTFGKRYGEKILKAGLYEGGKLAKRALRKQGIDMDRRKTLQKQTYDLKPQEAAEKKLRLLAQEDEVFGE